MTTTKEHTFRIAPPGLDLFVVAAISSHSVDFRVYDSVQPDDEVAAVSQAIEPAIHGHVTWEGCSNWATNGFLHACERHQLIAWGEALAACWDFASKHLPTWQQGGGNADR